MRLLKANLHPVFTVVFWNVRRSTAALPFFNIPSCFFATRSNVRKSSGSHTVAPKKGLRRCKNLERHYQTEVILHRIFEPLR